MIGGIPFPYGPDLASDDQVLREQALEKTIVFISNLKEMTDDDADKLWYVIRNGLWKTDGVITQHEFCKKIAASIFSVPESVVKVFVHSCFAGFAKEWGKVDKWRIEKYLVFVRYFVDKVHEWSESHSCEQDLIPMYEEVLSLKSGIGMQMQFVDVAVPHVTKLVRSKGGEFLKPFSSVFCLSHSQGALVKKIYEKMIEPLLDSEGETMFGVDSDGILHFFRGMVSLLGKSVKEEEPNQQTRTLRYDVLKRLKQSIALILKAREGAAAK